MINRLRLFSNILQSGKRGVATLLLEKRAQRVQLVQARHCAGHRRAGPAHLELFCSESATTVQFIRVDTARIDRDKRRVGRVHRGSSPSSYRHARHDDRR